MLWNNAFQSNISHIDAQHKALFEHIEQLGTMHGDISRIPKTIGFLELHTTEHFNDEESLHLKTRFPAATGHRKLHTDFVDTFWELKKKYDCSDGDFAAVMEVNKVVYDWLREHVLKVDKQFAKYYHALQEARPENS